MLHDDIAFDDPSHMHIGICVGIVMQRNVLNLQGSLSHVPDVETQLYGFTLGSLPVTKLTRFIAVAISSSSSCLQVHQPAMVAY